MTPRRPLSSPSCCSRASAPTIRGLDVAGRCDPARLAGGDFYLWVPTGDHVVIAVGDVSGKGLGAALVMTMVMRTATRLAHEARDPDPHELFRALSQRLSDYLAEAGMFITMVIGAYRLGDGDTIRLANAGHSPVVIGGTGGVVDLAPSAPPLGVLEDMRSPRAVEVPFVPGDVVVMGTDGLVEQENAERDQIGTELDRRPGRRRRRCIGQRPGRGAVRSRRTTCR